MSCHQAKPVLLTLLGLLVLWSFSCEYQNWDQSSPMVLATGWIPFVEILIEKMKPDFTDNIGVELKRKFHICLCFCCITRVVKQAYNFPVLNLILPPSSINGTTLFANLMNEIKPLLFEKMSGKSKIKSSLKSFFLGFPYYLSSDTKNGCES